MSIELILLGAFVLFPLLERLIRHLRGRAARSTADAAAVGPRPHPVQAPRAPAVVTDAAATASGETGAPPRVSSPVVMPPPLPRHPAVERISAGERVRAWRQSQVEEAAPVLDYVQSRTRLHGRADLQRAVILTAVLGRCKALENQAGPA